jgi:hypothetical protein
MRKRKRNANSNPRQLTLIHQRMSASLKSVAHPLRHKWVLYFDGASNSAQASDDATASGNEWDNALRDVCTFETVEDFWR